MGHERAPNFHEEEMLSPLYFDLQRDFPLFTFWLPREQLYFGVLSREVCLVLVKLSCMPTTLTDDSVSCFRPVKSFAVVRYFYHLYDCRQNLIPD